MFAWGWEAWMDIVRGLRNVSGRLFNAPDYREGTAWPFSKSWVLERPNILIKYLRYSC